ALDSFPLVAVPVFLFVGSVMNSAGISKYIYRFADTATGRLPGGLAQVNIFGSLIFAGMSGSALADIGGLGRIEIDAMRAKGFKPAFPAILAPIILIVGMLAGFFTPTEIASVTVAYTLLISAVFYRELSWQGILDAAFETIRASAGILLIVAVAALFGWILSV